MGRVARALILHELLERTRDRWVIVSTLLFALLAAGIALYGRSAGDAAAVITAPSLVTLSALLVPLVALILGYDAIVGERERHTLGLLLSLPVSRGEVLIAKFIGRGLALVLAIGLGLGSSALLLGGGQRGVLLSLIPPTTLLGGAFLSLGILLSVMARRQATAASLAVSAWFVLVFFWDLAILALLVATDGAIPQKAVAWLVFANPAGLYRVALLERLLGTDGLEGLGLALALPGPALRAALWAGFVVVPLGLGALVLGQRRAVTT